MAKVVGSKLDKVTNKIKMIEGSYSSKYMVIIMLKRRKESDTYLAADRRHCRSTQIAMKVDKVCSFQPALRPSSAEEEDGSCE